MWHVFANSNATPVGGISLRLLLITYAREVESFSNFTSCTPVLLNSQSLHTLPSLLQCPPNKNFKKKIKTKQANKHKKKIKTTMTTTTKNPSSFLHLSQVSNTSLSVLVALGVSVSHTLYALLSNQPYLLMFTAMSHWFGSRLLVSGTRPSLEPH